MSMLRAIRARGVGQRRWGERDGADGVGCSGARRPAPTRATRLRQRRNSAAIEARRPQVYCAKSCAISEATDYVKKAERHIVMTPNDLQT